MSSQQTIELPIQGMDCTECTMHVQHAIASVPGVKHVEVFLASEKAVVSLDDPQAALEPIRKAVAEAGYKVGEPDAASQAAAQGASFTRRIWTLLGVVFGVVLLVVVAGEWLRLFEKVTALVPWWVGVALVLIAGWPVFLNVIRASLHRQVISHTLMSLGVLAALVVGEWATAAVVVFFMRVGDYVEHFTAEKARRAVKDLTALAPQTARLLRGEDEEVVPVAQVHPGDIVIVRPGELIPVDGEVSAGHATINQAAITGESLPVEAGPGAQVFAATLVQAGSVRLRAAQVGADTTFGRVIRLVEQAEAHRAAVQRIADRFSAWYLPVVAGIAALTFIIRRDPLATAAVLVVACSCSFALATPIAMLASIGAGAKHGLMIKGGKYLEILASADTLLIDKTGTLTLGRLHITDVLPVDGVSSSDLLAFAAGVERYSEHPLAEAVRRKAREESIALAEPEDFESLPGLGVRAVIHGKRVAAGKWEFVAPSHLPAPILTGGGGESKSILYLSVDDQPIGALAASDEMRPETPAALQELRGLGFSAIEILTGDSPQSAAALGEALGVPVRAGLLPEDKIAIVQQYQQQGRRVVMVGDGINDAPALAQADVGMAMAAGGSGIALEAAHIALMRDDWRLVPEAVRIARRTMRVVKMNIAFTAVYNLVGLSLAAAGLLPPVLAAAAQSLPDLGILANSSRLAITKD
jgi:Cd2+/Zn2+-exporting ATPase/Cu+-exporting ATPase